MGCSISPAKVFLLVLNIVFLCFGVASFSLGIWVTVKKSEMFRLINLLDAKIANGANLAEIDLVSHHGMVSVAGYILVGLGFFTLIVGFCGFCGALKGSKCLLSTYAAIVSLALIGHIAVAIIVAVFQSQLRTFIITGMKKLQDNFFISILDYEAKKDSGSAKVLVTYLINRIQLSLECCGAEAVGDIAGSPSWIASNRNFGNSTLEVPLSCCRILKGRKSTVMSLSYNWSNFNHDVAQIDCICKFVGQNLGLNNMTCSSPLIAYAGQYTYPLIGFCVAVGLIELLSIVVACCLIRSTQSIDKKDTYIDFKDFEEDYGNLDTSEAPDKVETATHLME